MTYKFSYIPSKNALSSHKALSSLDAKLHDFFSTERKASSAKEYNELLKNIVTLIKNETSPEVFTPLHKKEIAFIAASKPLSEKVIWGGVNLKKVDVEKDFIQKLLVINQLGILGFEIHNEKLEKLSILEGYCLVIYRNNDSGWEEGVVRVQLASPQDKFTFQPKDEHGVIALTNCVIQETSTNHLDDLVYIFPSEQVTK